MDDFLQCNFCGKKKNDITILVSGINSHICDLCIIKTYSIIHNNHEHKTINNKNYIRNYKPKKILSLLDEYVVGQEKTKKILSVSLYNHYKRIFDDSFSSSSYKNENIKLEKSNVLLIGKTGTGKTLLAKSMAKILDIPFSISDATSLTEAGYVGEDVESILTRLLQSANYNVNQAEKGIIFLDEIDKISRKKNNPSITRDVSGEGVQQALLKILESSIVYVPPQGGRKHPEQKMIPINTENILFIAGGTFDGIQNIISKRKNETPIGFYPKKKTNNTDEILSVDLKEFGLIPELIGRFPIVTCLHSINRIFLKKILIEPKNSLIKQYKKLFHSEKISLSITNEALDIIVDKTMESGIGARGLRTFCEKIFMKYIFDIDNISPILNIDHKMVSQILCHS
ncbi:ATP-dependent Clp protease ATP-binding subunit ClpX [Blattabacterium cuenoti]|uniref:ATP-dependent Clp protease ATP-binding subunit ClpX n=1 Tax=Blattabacterium cuenoti TaxID=1653831 RepID=UPI00163B7146|nr:ATP-dependent Clp protease ATP-binding subunit ClpX [Blattabacterium cuenoti]